MLGRNRIQRVQSEIVEFIKMLFLFQTIDFVDRIKNGFGNAAQHVDQHGIKGRNTLFSVQDQNDEIRILDCLANLKPNLIGEIIFIRIDKPTGVDQRKRGFVPYGIAQIAIPCNPGEIIYQCIPGPGNTVKKSRLAHIGPADNSDDWFHHKLVSQIKGSPTVPSQKSSTRSVSAIISVTLKLYPNRDLEKSKIFAFFLKRYPVCLPSWTIRADPYRGTILWDTNALRRLEKRKSNGA